MVILFRLARREAGNEESSLALTPQREDVAGRRPDAVHHARCQPEEHRLRQIRKPLTPSRIPVVVRVELAVHTHRDPVLVPIELEG